MKTYLVTKSYLAAYPDPIKVKQGEIVTLGKVDDEYPGWVWCTLPHGKSSWAPEQYLVRDGDRGRFVCDYDATELTVDAGVSVVGLAEVAGWVWCRTGDGREGWLPENLLRLD